MTGAVRRAFVHVGLRKTGTSYLQSHLWESQDIVARGGVRLVPDRRERAVVLMRAVRERLDDPAKAERAVARFSREVSAATEPTLLLTQESLAGATAEQASALIAHFKDREVHVVVTARDLARQLPSAWQQRVKAHFDIGFDRFLEEVQERRGGAGRAFWAQQDLAAVLDRWSTAVPPRRIHVVTVPPPGADRTILPRRFGSVVGVDFAGLRAADVRTNDSLDPVQAELVRRLDRLHPLEDRRARADMVKNHLVARVLAPRRGRPASTPIDLREWCLAEANRQIQAVRSGGFSVTGDLGDLLPRAESFGPRMHEVTEAEVAQVAVQAVADLLADRQRLARELAHLRADATGTPAVAGEPTGDRGPASSRGWLRRRT